MKLTRLSLPITDGGTSPRTPGIHVSSILSHIAISQGLYSAWPSSPTQEQRDARRMKRIQGLAWEDWLAPRIAAHYSTFEYHLGELSLDGIIGTPDGISYESDGSILLHEIKHTKYSSRQLDFHSDSQWKLAPWTWQCMSYLRMLSEEAGCECTRAVVHPLFADGDYKENRWPQYTPVLLEFEWVEITGMWEVILNNKRYAKAETSEVTEE